MENDNKNNIQYSDKEPEIIEEIIDLSDESIELSDEKDKKEK